LTKGSPFVLRNLRAFWQSGPVMFNNERKEEKEPKCLSELKEVAHKLIILIFIELPPS